MEKILWNDGWVVKEKSGMFGLATDNNVRNVTLPYDAQLALDRDENAPFHSGCYPLGKWEYLKSFFVSEEDIDKKYILQFDGIYQNALIYVNGSFAASHNNGYTQFLVDITPYLRLNSENTVRVCVVLSDGARWYSGAGIYRDVYLYKSGRRHIAPRGVRISVPAADKEIADICVRTTVYKEGGRDLETLRLETVLYSPTGEMVAKANTPFSIRSQTDSLEKTLCVENPSIWSVDTPALYRCESKLYDENGILLDSHEETFGIRTFRVSPQKGLTLNGKPIKLAGCGLHHENGPVGAISTDSIEERKIQKLKDAGFNAIRTAHNPASEALLRACDKLGMLVMHEAFDTWTVSKVDFDRTLEFQHSWKEDLQALVDESFNHPSVLMYSIGNEIADFGNAAGTILGREITAYLKSLDRSRIVISCINGMVAVMDMMLEMGKQAQKKVEQEGQDAINTMMNGLGDQMKMIVQSDLVGNALEEGCSYLDVAGYNYMDSRYVMDGVKDPNRIFCGTETFIPTIDENWRLVMEMPNVIGDFCWTGWDYCGEPGTGLVKHVVPPMELGMGLPYPCLLSEVGEFTISGFRRPASYFHEIVLGKRRQPYIAVCRPEHHDGINITTPWSWSDAIASWSWKGYEGKPVTVEVYSDAETVELFLNERSLGKAPCGKDHHYKAVFEAVYEPGRLEAVAYYDDQCSERFSLQTTDGPIHLTAAAEENAYMLADRPVIYLPIQAEDHNGVTDVTCCDKISAVIEGPAEFLGFGTDEPCPTESFHDHRRTLYDGRAILVLRPTAPGVIRVTFTGEEGLNASAEVTVQEG